MIPIRYKEPKLFSPFHGDFDPLMRLWQEPDLRRAPAEWTPATDVIEGAEHFELYVDLPGVSINDIDITLQNDTLTISGHRASETEPAGSEAAVQRVERRQGQFWRQFVLPNSVDSEAIEARCELGVIKIIVPKKSHARPRRIPVAETA